MTEREGLPPLFSPGDLIQGRYRITRLVGQGGMGEVYRAGDLAAERDVAVKIVLPELLGSGKARARFEREVRWTRSLDHRNIIRILDYFNIPPIPGRPTEQAIPCVVMEFLDGESLADRLQRASDPVLPEDALPIICQMAAALSAAHKKGIVHRDLKPDNIFLVPQAGFPRVVLTDFGVARKGAETAFGDQELSEESLTASNIIVGTPEFMAPELLELEDAIPASDIYSLGLIFYEMVTGHRPFDDERPLQALFKRVQYPAPSPREYVPELDDRTVEVITECLRRRPEDRYERAEMVIEALDGPDSPFLKNTTSWGREKAFTAAVGAGLVLLTALLVWFYAV